MLSSRLRHSSHHGVAHCAGRSRVLSTAVHIVCSCVLDLPQSGPGPLDSRQQTTLQIVEDLATRASMMGESDNDCVLAAPLRTAPVTMRGAAASIDRHVARR